MAEPIANPTRIEALIEGGVSGQVAVGNYNVQIHADHGAVVHLLPPDRQPQPRLRPSPVLLRPRAFRGLLGRQAEVSTTASALRDGLPVEIFGVPGIGKSALLRHFAYELETGSLPGGVVHLSAREQPAADLVQGLVDAFYESDVPFKPTETQARHLLQGRRALVLVDDVTLAREEIENLLDTAPGCAFILATQERHLWSEARAVPLAGLPTDDARALLERELGRPLTPAEQAAASELCARLECHPLRLLQAAALVREGQRSMADLSVEAAAEATRSAAGREAVNRDVLEALDPAERRVVALLAAAEGMPVGLEVLRELAGPDVEQVLDRLRERRVVQTHSPRYSLRIELDGETWRAWEIDSWRERLFSQWTLWAERNPSRVLEEAASLLQVARRAYETGQWQVVRHLGKALDTPLTVAGRWAAWAQVLERGLRAAEALGDEAGRGWALHQRGTRALCLGDRHQARHDLTRALEIREGLGDAAGAAVTRHNLGLLLGPAAPESPAGPGPRRAFPRLLAWIGLPLLLLLLTLGGMRLWQGRTDLGNGGSARPEAPLSEATTVVLEESPFPTAPETVPEIPTETPTAPPVTTPVETPGTLEETPSGTPEETPSGTPEGTPSGPAEETPVLPDGTDPVSPGLPGGERGSPTGTTDGAAAVRGWCCIAGQLSETSEADCRERQGGFFKRRLSASLACTAAKTGCCVDGEFRAGVAAEECDRLQGQAMTLLEAGFTCRKRRETPAQPATPPPPVQGWCCLNYQVFETVEERCATAQGTFFTNKADADKACTYVVR